jgi:hypothetical protein
MDHLGLGLAYMKSKNSSGYKRSIECFQVLTTKHDARSPVNVNYCLPKDCVVCQNWYEPEKYFEEAAKQEHAIGQFNYEISGVQKFVTCIKLKVFIITF